ncbi:MAG: dTDP-4-dehydrorhamnose 3,5-epimerase [Planctomycetes bacterium]|nr:dTDP-4-dehydrorhamnose 3,5-epimerase [Planctomycetota bacterium]
MKVLKTDLEGLLLIEPQVFGDDRGFFLETYHKPRFHEAGITCEFVQDNHSRSVKDTLRGLHFQKEPGQAKLVRAVRGSIFDVAVDIRPDSPTFGKWVGYELSEQNHRMLFVPIGFAHGFVVTSDVADVSYKCSWVYVPETEAGIMWNDPDVGVEWPVANPLLSNRDQGNPTLREYLPQAF